MGCIFFVVVTWVAQSEVAQYLETTNYNKPYIITWFNHCLCSLQGLVLLCGRRKQGQPSPFSEMTGRQVLGQVIFITTAYQVADWVWYVGLASTSVAAGTIIYNSMSIFVFIFEWLLGRQQLSVSRILAILVALVGVVLVEYKPGDNNVPAGCLSQLSANILVLIAAILYAAYQVSLERILPASSTAGTTSAFVSLQGLITLFALWPGFLLMAYAPGCFKEIVEAPEPSAVTGLLVNGGLALAFNVLFCYAIVWTSALTTSVGCMLTVPASMVADYYSHGDAFAPYAACGSVLVFAGFFVIARSTIEDGEDSN